MELIERIREVAESQCDPHCVHYVPLIVSLRAQVVAVDFTLQAIVEQHEFRVSTKYKVHSGYKQQ